MASARHVLLRDLEVRPDGDHYVVGRIDTGRFVDLPPVGVRTLDLIREHGYLAEVAAQLRAEVGEEVAVHKFVTALRGLGFVAEVDGVPEPDPAAQQKVTFPSITPASVRWMIHPVLIGAVLVLIALGAVVALTHLGELPRPAEAVWTSWGSLVMLASAVEIWLLIFAHEMAHLGVARAYGVPSQITLGTRLENLCAQTDVSGMWAKARGPRMLVYLSGMMFTASVASVAVIALVVLDSGVLYTVAVVVFISQAECLLLQARVFVRTDLYFVMQDLLRCRNLYTDGWRYVGYLWARAWRRPAADPTAHLTRRERLSIRVYAAFFAPSTVFTIVAYVWFSIPILVTLLVNAGRHAVAGDSVLMALDGLVTIAVLLGIKVLWARAWWRRHGPRVRRVLTRRRPPQSGPPRASSVPTATAR